MAVLVTIGGALGLGNIGWGDWVLVKRYGRFCALTAVGDSSEILGLRGMIKPGLQAAAGGTESTIHHQGEYIHTRTRLFEGLARTWVRRWRGVCAGASGCIGTVIHFK